MIELGISTFGETTPLETIGKPISHAERIRNLIEEIELADKVGLDIYAIGEHHREDFAVSAPEIVLAAGAVNTKNIKLSSAVTVLSSDDPVRVYEQYSTIDALSNGRAEVMVGRGSFTESFPLFGYNLRDYEELFDEKLDMLQEINKGGRVNWQGRKHTQSIDNLEIFPRLENKKLPLWVATGGNVESTYKIAKKGLPITYAIIGGNPLGFKQLIDVYRNIRIQAGHSLADIKVGEHSWGYIDNTTEEAVAKYYYPTKQTVDAISKDRPFWRPLTEENYEQMIGPYGAIIVGNPEVAANKIIHIVENLGLDRFLLHLPIGSLPHEDIMRAIKLFGEEVAPKVRQYFVNR